MQAKENKGEKKKGGGGGGGGNYQNIPNSAIIFKYLKTEYTMLLFTSETQKKSIWQV